MVNTKTILIKYFFVILILPILFFSKVQIFALTPDELKEQIQSVTKQKLQIQADIDAYEKQLKDIGDQTASLKNTLKSLDVTISKNLLDIRMTENDVDSVTLQIQELSLGIDKDIKIIDLNLRTIASLLRETNYYDGNSVIGNFLAYNDLSEFWNYQQNLFQVQNQIQEKTAETKNTKTKLEHTRNDAQAKKQELLKLKSELLDRKNILEITKKEKNKLLKDTQNSESNYKKMLAEKKALADAFDKELVQFESELKLSIDPNSYPSAGTGVLSWPLDIVKITQKFGMTEYAKTSGSYSNSAIGHNGVDFKASIGTSVKTALSGVVKGIGDTDIVCPGKSFGKWVLVEHNNGLSTIYAHLSLIRVATGDIVTTGDVIGYSGNTGFSTGPHLHFGVYATQGVKIMSRKSTICSGTYIMPIADLRAYLDPLQYL